MSSEQARVFLLDAEELVRTRRALGQGEEALMAADQRLLQEANEALASGMLAAEEGLASLCGGVQTLGLGYYLSDHEPFAEGAALLLRRAFLDEDALLEPQAQDPGEVGARLPLSWLVDAVGLIGASPAWSQEDQQGLESWASRYLDWLQHSEPGLAAGRARDHLGTWVDLQVAALALFTGQEAQARQVLGQQVLIRLEEQFDAQGRQPLELRQADALSCSLSNLVGFFDLADLGRQVGVSLWDWQGKGGQSLRQAFSWLVEQGLDQEWSHAQEGYFDPVWWLPLLRRGARRWADPDAEAKLRALPEVDWAADRSNLLYPPLV